MSGTRSKQVRNAEIKVITDLLDDWKTDKEIIAQLNESGADISPATYYRYKSSIYKQDKKLLEKIRTDELAHRSKQVRNALEYCIKINKDICEHSKDPAARRESSKLLVQAQMGLLNLALEPAYKEQIRIISRDVTEDTKKQLE